MSHQESQPDNNIKPHGHHYFRMKVGSGNNLFYPSLWASDYKLFGKCDSLIAMETHLAENGIGLSFSMWTGFKSNIWIPVYDNQSAKFLKKDVATKAISNLSKAELSEPDDFFHLAYGFSKPEAVKILIYGMKYLFICEPVNTEGCWSDEINNYPNSNNFDHCGVQKFKKDLLRCIEDGLGKSNKEDFNSRRFYPIKIIKAILREDLMPSVDSLAVYQYLSRGTFRPLYSIAGARNEVIEKYLDSDLITNDPRLQRTKRIDRHRENRDQVIRIENETWFGLFYRLYLDSKVFPTTSVHGTPLLNLIPELHLIMLSPVQLESLSAIFLRDMNYLPDFYVGGSHDLIDVRARTVDNFQLPSKMQTALRDKILNRLGQPRTKGVLTIQCKDYQSTNEEAAANIADIFIEPLEDKNPNVISKRISIEEILRIMDGLPADKDFLFDLQIWIKSNRIQFLF